MKKTPILIAVLIGLLGIFLLITDNQEQPIVLIPTNDTTANCNGIQVEIDDELQEIDPFDLRAIEAAHETYLSSYANPLEQLVIRKTKRIIIRNRILQDNQTLTYTYVAYDHNKSEITHGIISGKLIATTRTDSEYQPTSECTILYKK